MKTITSFTIDHYHHPAGIYLSRQDDDIYTYDVRICEPYRDALMTNSEMHSLEHVLATILRNGEYANQVIYVGPMGCQTGFYVLFKNIPLALAKPILYQAFQSVCDFQETMPGNTAKECGNYSNLQIEAAKHIASVFLQRLQRNA